MKTSPPTILYIPALGRTYWYLMADARHYQQRRHGDKLTEVELRQRYGPVLAVEITQW